MQIKIPYSIPDDNGKWEDVLIEFEHDRTIDFINPQTEEVIARFQTDDLEIILSCLIKFNEKNKSCSS